MLRQGFVVERGSYRKLRINNLHVLDNYSIITLNNDKGGDGIKKRLCILIVFCLTAGLTACTGGTPGVPDQTGAWGQINQLIARGENWEQIVEQSEFQTDEEVVSSGIPLNNYPAGWRTYPLIDGSTVCVPMAVEFARQHLKYSDEAANNLVQFSTTEYAYKNLIGNNPAGPDIILATEPSDEELALAEQNHITLIAEPVCYDAFVFITHKDNPVDSLTIEQIQDIYSGKITNWKQVGGKNEKIRAYQREENSGSQTTMQKRVMQGREMLPPDKIEVAGAMGMLVDSVAEYNNRSSSIGYTFRYYIDTLYKNEAIKIMKVNGVEPTDSAIQNGSYPFTANYYGVIRSEDKEEQGGKFLRWMLSEEGQRCIGQAGYCRLNPAEN